MNDSADAGAVHEEVALTIGGQHFGRWWVARVETGTHAGREAECLFIGYQGSDLVQMHGLGAARALAAQLASAIEHAETSLSH